MYENLRDLAIIIVIAEVIGLILRKIKLPQVVGQILAGLIIGPCVLGWVDNTKYIQIFSEIGVILLMFSAGLETNIKTLLKTGPIALLMACCGVLFPLVGGTLISMAFHGMPQFGSQEFVRDVFIGTIMTATSVSITVQTLKELGKISTTLGTTIVSAAIIDDVIGIIVLTVVLGAWGGDGAGNSSAVWMTIVKTLVFFVLAGTLGFGLYKLFKLLSKKYTHHRRITVISLAFCFGLSYVAEKYFGVADITGAYVAGVILCNIEDAKYVDSKMEVGSYLFFGPVFFASIGLKTNISGLTMSLLAFSGCFVAVAILTKIIGCGFAAKVTKHSFRESLIAGVGMMTRGEVALVVAQKGLDAGIISSEYFTPVILLIIITSVFTPILLRVLFRSISKRPPKGKLKQA